MKLSQAEINQAISQLPENIKYAVESFDWENAIMKAREIHGLSLDKINTFHQQTLLVVIGESPAAEYENNLISEMGISTETADKLVAFANKNIFRALQRSAFSTKEEVNPVDNEDYLLHDIKHSLATENHTPDIKEVMDNNPSDEILNLDLDQTEFDLLYTKNGIVPGMVEKKTTPHTKEDIAQEKDDGRLNNQDFQKYIKENYQEVIEEKDTQGIRKHTIDTSILRKNSQENPENVLDVDIDEVLAPFSTKKPSKKQTLEKQAMELGILSKGDKLDLSFHESDFGKEMKSFMETLEEDSD